MSDQNTIHDPQKANALIRESSPYLLQHAYNPVQWHPWGEEALQKAHAEDKPILVSIGYSACHWCHVMERESFENDEIANVMNAHFINIKVDREERPDIDQIYMEALHTMNLRGGWPLNVFLTPEAKPFYGGTYFPPAHWADVLKQIGAAFDTHRKDLEDSAEGFARSLNTSEIHKYGLNEQGLAFKKEALNAGYEKLEKKFDRKMGGMLGAPKFPMPSIYLFLLRYHKLSGNEEALRQVKRSLDHMAMGGLYDQAGGGFARYSTDEEWFAPHFEKMLYDNGQLISLYSEAFCLTQEPLYRRVVYETIAWIQKEMTSAAGAFYSALDADSEGHEGKFYVWTQEQISELFPEEFPLISEYYNITAEGNWEEGQNILFRNFSDTAFANKHGISLALLEEKVRDWNAVLLQQRASRIRPGLDDKVLISWNGILLKGLVDAYRTFDEPQFLEMGLKNAAFLKSEARDNTALFHSWKNGKASIQGFLEDYAFVVQGYIHLYQACFDEAWLQQASILTEHVLQHFYDAEEGLFFFTSDTADALIARKKELFDNVIPASNSVMAANLYWLGILLDNEKYSRIALQMLGRISKMIPVDIAYLSNWACLYTYQLQPTAEIAIVGKDCLEYRKSFDKHYLPNAVFTGTTDSSELPLLQQRYAGVNGETMVFVCHHKTCGLPVDNVDGALKQIDGAES